jgi:hypothetical protein
MIATLTRFTYPYTTIRLLIRTGVKSSQIPYWARGPNILALSLPWPCSMAINKQRGATKKLGSVVCTPREFPVSLGRKVVHFKTKNHARHFTIHEDLLCANSKFFKMRLQKVRKNIEGECPICQDELDRRKDDIVFCGSSCGQNIHEKCIEQWNRVRAGSMTCPMCRKVWEQKKEDLIELKQELDPGAVHVYLEWLYTGELRIDEDIKRDSDDYNVCLLKAWSVSDAVEDANFRQAIITEHIRVVTQRQCKF